MRWSCFPEGTSNDGNRILPFRSALLSVAEAASPERPLAIQPVSIAYTSVNGVPLGWGLRPLVAWYGGMELGGHLWRFSRLGQVEVVVQFHGETGLGDFASRKELTRHCSEAVAGRGRPRAGRPAARPLRRAAKDLTMTTG